MSSKSKEQQLKDLSALLAEVGHELRTPLTAIQAFAELIASGKEEEEHPYYANLILEAAERLNIMINEFLDVQRLDLGDISLNYQRVPAQDIIDPLNKIYASQAMKKGLEFVCINTLPPDTVLSVDPVRIDQIMGNLLNNAIKFTDEGAVSLELASDGENGIAIVVKDTGIGIQAEEFNKLFERFYQAAHGRKGTGLGLHIAAALVEAQRGSINIESTAGKGSTFTVKIPDCVLKRKDALETKEAEEIGYLSEIMEVGNLKVLVAEDDPMSRVAIVQSLKQFGVDCDLALDGKEAVKYAMRKSYDLILMDIKMPVMDGLRASRAIHEFSRVPIVGMSANTSEQFAVHSFGMTDFLLKPIKQSDLARILQRIAV